MKTKIILVLITLLNLNLSFAQDSSQKVEVDTTKERLFQATLIPGFGTGNGAKEMYQNKISLNVFAGHEYSFKGVELGSFYNINTGNTT